MNLKPNRLTIAGRNRKCTARYALTAFDHLIHAEMDHNKDMRSLTEMQTDRVEHAPETSRKRRRAQDAADAHRRWQEEADGNRRRKDAERRRRAEEERLRMEQERLGQAAELEQERLKMEQERLKREAAELEEERLKRELERRKRQAEMQKRERLVKALQEAEEEVSLLTPLPDLKTRSRLVMLRLHGDKTNDPRKIELGRRILDHKNKFFP